MPHSEQHNHYPATDTLKCDPRMARLLFRAYYDELTTVSTYIYNSIQLACDCPQTAALYESIAMTEMRHFRLLGQAIRRMGGNPVIRTDLRIPSLEICHDTPRQCIDHSARGSVRAAIAGEQTAAWEYRALAEKTRDEALKALLCRLAADEEEHAHLFQNLCGC